ncbi:hypothetical protein NLI96_g6042 [Meripilus lineatus]|uniref:Uncharacterized protein n=1 Tax=Meripilus lineatus TaxID=2056292 RepID=A0AAD5V1Z2_9APHY|nr:hypothetical protein NLI96_g6042 [Physisporinus lineatus]
MSKVQQGSILSRTDYGARAKGQFHSYHFSASDPHRVPFNHSSITSLVEHDQEPYCKTCHVKNFGTRDLRHANLPDRDDVFISPPTSPTRATPTLPPLPPRSTPVSTRTTSHTGTPSSTAPALPVRRTQTGGGPFDRSKSVVSPPPILRPNRALSPTRGTAADPYRPPTNGNADTNGTTQVDTIIEQTEEMKDVKMEGGDTDEEEEQVEKHLTQEPPDSPVKFTPTHTHTGRSIGGLPRTIPLTPFMTSAARPTHSANSSINSFSIPDSDGATASNLPTGPITPMKSYQATPLTISKSSSLNSISSVGSNGTGGRIHVPLTATLSNGTGTRYGAALGGIRGTPTGSPRTWGGGTPTCGKCGKTVYFAEQSVIRPSIQVDLRRRRAHHIAIDVTASCMVRKGVGTLYWESPGVNTTSVAWPDWLTSA